MVGLLADILAGARDTALERLARGRGPAPWNAGKDAEDRVLAELAASTLGRAELRAEASLAFDGADQDPDPPEVRIATSGVMVLAARLLGEATIAAEAARRHARATLDVVREIASRPPTSLLVRSLELAEQCGLTDSDPDLVADLHLEAGNRYMRPTSPVYEKVYLGLESFTAAYRLKARSGSPDVAQLAENVRQAAGFTLNMARLTGAMPGGTGATGAKLRQRAVLDAYEALGDAQGLRSARLTAARQLLAERRLTEAEPHLAALVAAGGDESQRAELAMLHADALLQRAAAAEPPDLALAAAALALVDGAAPAVVDPLFRWHGAVVRARALRLLGRPGEAAAALRTLTAELEAHLLEQRRDAGARALLCSARAQRGALACAAGSAAEGLQLFADALGAVDHMQQFEQLEAHRVAGAALWEVGAVDDALPHLATACRLMMQLVGAIEDPPQQSAFRAEWQHLEQQRVEALLRAGRADDAFDLMEESKVRELRGVVTGFGGDLAAVPAELAAEYTDVQRRIGYLETYLGRLGVVPAGGPAGAAEEELAGAAAAEVGALRRRAEVVLRLAEREMLAARAADPAAKNLATVLRGEPQSAAEASDALVGGGADADADAVLSYLATANGIAVVVRRGGVTSGRWLPLPWSEVAVLAAAAAGGGTATAADGGAVAGGEFDAALARLGELLLDPVADLLEGVRDLVVVPHRGLHSIPWAAVGGSTPLLQRVGSVTVLPSVLLGRALAERPASAGGGATRADSGILRVAPSDGLPGVTPPPAIPVFRGGSGRLEGAQVCGLLDLRGREVTVLTDGPATVPARSDQVVSETPPALPVALLAVGSRWVVAGLWPVPEGMGAGLLGEFERQFAAQPAGPARVPRALAEAQRRLRSLPAGGELPPGHWAAFVCFGSAAAE